MNLFLVVLVAIGGLGVYAWYNSKAESIKRYLRNAQQFGVGEFPDSQQGKIVGTLKLLGEELVAPLSGRRCAFYKVRVQEYRSRGKSGSWYDIINEEHSVDFGLEDGTGEAIVLVAAAETVLTNDHETRSGTFDDPTPTERRYLDAHGKEGIGWIMNKSIRYIEAVLEPGEKVSVYGYGSKEPDPKSPGVGYRDMPAMRLRMSGTVKHPLLISDLPSVH